MQRDILHQIDAEARAAKLRLDSGGEVPRAEMSVAFNQIIRSMAKAFRLMS